MSMASKYLILIATLMSSVLVLSSCLPAQDRVDELESENQSLADLRTQLEEQLRQLEAANQLPADIVLELEEENQSLTNLIVELEEQITVLEAENQLLADLMTDLESQLHSLSEQQQITHAPLEGWEEYFPDFDQTTLTGETTERLEELLGKPPYLIRSTAVNSEFSREIWIFTPYQEDPTGLYLFFQDSKLTGSLLDEFQGLHRSGLLDDDDFWR